MLAVTVNVGGASPHARSEHRALAMGRWAQRVIAQRRPELVFAQEVPSDAWLKIWAHSGYTVVQNAPRYQARSALIIDKKLSAAALTAARLPTLNYHGSYVAAAHCTLPRLGRPVILLTVHASPAPVTDAELAAWPSRVERPKPRHGGKGVHNESQLWDADMVLQTIMHATELGPVLACGDLNESRAWDALHPGETWGEEFFERVEDRLVDCLHDRLPSGSVTHWAPDAPAMQIDHVLASRDVAPLLVNAALPTLDEQWADPRAALRNDLSDHAPIWFSIAD